jgi:hypothetical protein
MCLTVSTMCFDCISHVFWWYQPCVLTVSAMCLTVSAMCFDGISPVFWLYRPCVWLYLPCVLTVSAMCFDCISHVFWHIKTKCGIFVDDFINIIVLTFGSNWPYSLRGEHWNVKSIQMTDGCQKLTWPFGSDELISGSFSNTKCLWVYTCTC